MTKAAVYRFYDADDVLLYIGMSQCPFKRSVDHARTAVWYFDVVYMEVEWFKCEDLAHLAERVSIDRERPIHNTLHRHSARKLARTPDQKYLVGKFTNLPDGTIRQDESPEEIMIKMGLGG